MFYYNIKHNDKECYLKTPVKIECIELELSKAFMTEMVTDSDWDNKDSDIYKCKSIDELNCLLKIYDYDNFEFTPYGDWDDQTMNYFCRDIAVNEVDKNEFNTFRKKLAPRNHCYIFDILENYLSKNKGELKWKQAQN